jgi:hypothetical protein
MSDIAKLMPVVALEAPTTRLSANAMSTPDRHPACDDHDERGTPFLCARCAQLHRGDKRKASESAVVMPDAAPDPRIEVVARALHLIECQEADRERRNNRMPPVERWADPWSTCGSPQLVKLRRQASVIVAALDGV